MKPWRRFAMLGFGAAMLLLGVGFSYGALARADRELVAWFAGFGMIFGGIGLLFTIRALNAKRLESLTDLEDADATAQFSLSRLDRYGMIASLLLVTLGFGLWAIDGFALLIRIAGALVSIISACGLIAVLRQRHLPTLRFSPEGLEFTGFGCGPNAWRDIRSAEPSNGRVPMVLLDLRDEQKYQSRRPKSRWGGAGFAVVSPVLGLTPDMMARAIDTRRAAFGQTEARVLR